MKVLLIENQKVQFDKISCLLSNNKFEIVPTEDCFPCLMNLVKIILNMENSESRRNKAQEEFFSYIEVEKPEIYLIDYKISGSTFAGTGLELGAIINKKFPYIPIIFLSKYSENVEDIKEKLAGFSFQNWKWIEKGYAGQAIVDENYMKKYLLNSIYELVNDNIFNEERKNAEDLVVQAIGEFMKIIADFPDVDENIFTRQIENQFKILTTQFEIKTQVSRGFSASGKKMGTVDVEIYDLNNKSLLIADAEILSSIVSKNIDDHINRLLVNYNTDGKPFVLLFIYYIGKNFQKFVSRYSDYINNLDFSKFDIFLKLNKTIARKNAESNNNQNIEIIEQKLSCGIKHKRIHHILANFNVTEK